MKLTTTQKTGFGIGAVGKDIVYAFVAGYILYFYNDILGISGTFTGIIMMIARVIDALNDPIMGVVVEKTNTKYGKFRPWIFSGTVLNALILYGMFAVPEHLTGTPLLVYTSVFYILWGVTYTLMDIPFWSMIPAITSAGDERQSLSIIGRVCASVGYAIPTVLTMQIVTRVRGGERSGFALLAFIIAVIFVVFELFCIFFIKEKPVPKKDTPTLKEMFSSLFNNDQAIVVVVSIILFNASLYLTTQLGTYFFKYDIGNSQLFSVFGMVGSVGQILSMITLPFLRKHFTCKRILTGSILTSILGYTLLFILGSLNIKNMVLLCLCGFIIYIGFGLATVLTTIFLADTVDYGQYKTGQRNESVIFSMQTFVVKLASAISVLIAGVGIDIIGLDKSAEVQTTSTLLGLRFIMIVLPIAGLIVSIIYFRKKYILTEDKLKEITDDLSKNH